MRAAVFIAVAGLAMATGTQATSFDIIDKLKSDAKAIDAELANKTQAALDAVIDKKNELMSEGVTIVGDKVEAADTMKYDKIGQVTGKYYCEPGYCTFPPVRRRSLLQGSSRCVECGPDYYCPGGFQSLTDPNKVACPGPTTNIVDFTTNGVTTATSRDQCLVDVAPGYYVTDPAFGPALPCGYGYYCPGGVQTSSTPTRILCPGTNQNTTSATATSPTDCCTVGVDCP